MKGWRRWPLVVAVVLLVLAVPAMAPASVQEQRARLPPAAHCDDPVEGVWKSHKYDPRFGDWYMFTLTIRRVAERPNSLTGTIHSHSWSGTPQEEEPPPCRSGMFHWTVIMTAEGTVSSDGRDIAFGGTSWRPEQAICGRAPGPGEYNLDRFSGTIDPDIQEFQSVNNDGGRSVNDPMVFRRISCFDEPPSPEVSPVPPAFYPRRGGCSWF